MLPRLAVARFRHLTNRFTPGRTDQGALTSLLRGDEVHHPAAGPILNLILRRSAALSRWEPVPILAVDAAPGGPVPRDVFEAVAGEMEAGLLKISPDALLLDLPGTTILDDGASGEEVLVRRARAALGPAVPIVVTGSPLFTFPPTLIDIADAIVIADDLLAANPVSDSSFPTTLAQVITGQMGWTSAIRTLPLLLPATRFMGETAASAVLLGIVQETRQIPGVLHAGVALGFAYADSPHAGTTLFVVTDGDPVLGERLADDLAAAVWSQRPALTPATPTVEEAIHAVMAGISVPGDTQPPATGPVVLLDAGDDLRGGARGDGTALLWGLLDLGVTETLLGVLVDPAAVATAFAAGAGARVELPLGAAFGEEHSFPIDVVATVGAVSPEGAREPGAGRTALLRCEGRYGQPVEVIVGERPPSGAGDIFGPLGVDPLTRRIVAIKPGTPLPAGLREAEVLLVDTPGPTRLGLDYLPFRHVPRPIWPLDAVRDNPAAWRIG